MTDTWRTNFRIKRQLDQSELALYEKYREYCLKIGCDPEQIATEERWRVTTQGIPNQ